MKRNDSERSGRWIAGFRPAMVLAVVVVFWPAAVAQTYRLTSSSIDGGGGESRGGRFRVEGTVGRPSSGPLMIGLKYRIEGGIWASPESPPELEGPVLSIQWIDAKRLQISWKGEPGQWQLEQNLGLNPLGWTDVAGGIQAPVLLPSSETAQLFRLRSKP